jgi:D-alanyl-D-alanine dipeptidase
MMLVPITPESHGVELELAYATADNFTGRPIYRRALAYLRPEAAECLARAAALAARQGLRFRIYDAFRPSEAQWALWAVCPDPTYVADPRRGSPHTRGVAVDLTLVDPRGRPLDMGTPFDSLDPASHHEAPGLSAEVERNRLLLLGIMTTAGWDHYRNEWWHYQLFDARARYPLLSDSVAPIGLMTPD